MSGFPDASFSIIYHNSFTITASHFKKCYDQLLINHSMVTALYNKIKLNHSIFSYSAVHVIVLSITNLVVVHNQIYNPLECD